MTAKTRATKATANAAAAATKDVVDSVVATNKEVVESVVKAGTEAAQQSYAQAFNATKDQMEKASSQLFNVYDEATSFSKGNVEALIASGNVFAKGVEDLSKTTMTYYQTSVEAGVNVAKSMLACKTVREVVDLQTDFARTNFDKFVSESTKISEMALKVANETAEPLQERANKAVQVFVKPIAA